MIKMYWVFEKINGRLKELGECILGLSNSDAVESAREKFHFTGDIIAVSDRAMFPRDYVGIHGGIDIVSPQKQKKE